MNRPGGSLITIPPLICYDSYMDKLLKPKYQIWMSWFIIISSIIGWPLSALTVAKDEPLVILSISWLALIYSGYSALVAAQADKHIQDK